MSTSNELPVFISSTFRDLQEEREHLVKTIIPEMLIRPCGRVRLRRGRERGVIFTAIDLPCRITSEDIAIKEMSTPDAQA